MTTTPARFRHTGTALALALGLGAGALLGAALYSGATSDPAPLDADMVRVTIGDGPALLVARTEVTRRDWAACHAAGGCALALDAPGEDPDYPATGLSYLDAQEYLAWINAAGGPRYRLPTRAEWYALAHEVLPEPPAPLFTAPELAWASAYALTPRAVDPVLRPSGGFSTTAAGIADLDGNVWEWTQDCYDGDAGRSEPGHCPAFVLGGLHESVMAYLVRDPAQGGCAVGAPPAHLGFRLVRDAGS